MTTNESLKQLVREKYSEIALQDKVQNAASCCGAGPAGTYTIMSDAYDGLSGYDADADLSLGCGLPTQFAHIRAGDTVLDLGSGAGNDCFVARAETGAEGKVIGVDFTPAMIQKARVNAERLGYNNVEFREGDIEDLPVTDGTVDVAVSNCVLNLVPDKAKVFAEIFRVLRPGGHFSLSDVVLVGALPDALRETAEMYAGCVSGAIQRDAYLGFIHEAGFTNVLVQKEKPILIPDEVLRAYLTEAEADAFRASPGGIFSVTVYAEKPGDKPRRDLRTLTTACTPGGGCC